ncbi:MAG: hypothetical protein AB8B53_06020 [Flavobacteriales bacterium]
MSFMKLSLVLFGFLMSLAALSQLDSNTIVIQGKVLDEHGSYVSDAIVVNERTFMGVFVDLDGTFSYEALRNDTIRIGSFGKSPSFYCFADSLGKDTFNVTVTLPLMTYYVGQANVIAERDLMEIQEDIEELGYDKTDYMLSGIDPLSSPITFLYQQFSREERSKRKVYEMENADRRRALLKELFKKYVAYEIIDLSEEEFDNFIDYINISDYLLQNTSQYDFIVYVKARFNTYSRLIQEDDFDYHKD